MVTPWWTSLMLLKPFPFRTSFTLKSLLMPNVASREDVGSHRLIWEQETATYSKCSKQACCHETAASRCCFLTWFQDIQQVAYWLFACPVSQWHKSFPHFHWPSRNWPAWTRIILQQFHAFLKMCEPLEDLHTTQSYTFFRFWYTSMAVFPDLQQKLIMACCFILRLLTGETITHLLCQW